MRLVVLISIVTLVFVSVSSGRERVGTLRAEPGDTLMPSTTEEIPKAEDLFDQIETESENIELMDRLLWLAQHPYDLNAVRREELESIPGVTPEEARMVIEFRKSVKRFTSVDQILLIEWIGETVHRKISAYVTVNEPESVRSSTSTLRTRATKDLQPRRGYSEGKFLGSPLKTYNRFSMTSSSFEAGALFEKDPGERTSDGFATGYVRVRDISIISDAIVGDFIVEAGQGLVLWRASAFGKGSEAVSIARKSPLGAQPYRSTDEFHFFRGAAVSASIPIGVSTLQVTTFVSRRSLSGTPSGSDTLSSVSEEGYFRTDTELAKKNALTERVVGAIARFRASSNFALGVSAYKSTFNKDVVANTPSSFIGRETRIAGVDASGQLGKLSLYGELARTGDGAGAGLAGAILGLNPHGSVALVYRDYSLQFHNLHGNGFGERSETSNERGMYLGVEVPIARKLKLFAYFDQFKFPMPTFSSSLPLSGHELLVQVEANVVRKVDLIGRFTSKTTEMDETTTDPYSHEVKATVVRSQQKARVTGAYNLSRTIRLKGRIDATRVEYSRVRKKESGILLYQEIQSNLTENFKVEMRLIFFDTDSYDSRLYEYENDLHGVFSNPALYGKGRRWYALVSYKFANSLHLSAKYSETRKDGVKSISSGLTEISGDLDNRISLQLEVTL